MTSDDEHEVYRRYVEAIPQRERQVWSQRGPELLAWTRDRGASWLWEYVNRRLEASLDGSAGDALVSSSLRTVLDGVRHGLVLVSANLRVLHANPAMAGMLEAGRPFVVQDGMLGAATRGARPAIDAVRDLLARDDAEALTLHERIDPGVREAARSPRLFLRVERLQAEDSADGQRPLPIGLLQLWAEGPGRGPEEAALRAWFDLTQAEARLASAFAGGATLADYAESEALSMHTVRTQFAQLRRKMDARDQADVLRILLQLTGV